MEILRNNEEKVMCPYNPAHYIRKCRMEVHLTKCRKQFKEGNLLVECDFNSCHRIPQPELQYHHKVCPDRKDFELQIFTEHKPVCDPIKTRPPMPVPVDTSWDGVDVPTYDPQKYCEENDILRHIDVESASIKRQFRMAERHRLNNLGPSVKATTRGRREPSDEAFVVDNQRSLPPTPSFSASSIEQPPDNVVNMMQKLSLIPKRAVIPIQKKN